MITKAAYSWLLVSQGSLKCKAYNAEMISKLFEGNQEYSSCPLALHAWKLAIYLVVHGMTFSSKSLVYAVQVISSHIPGFWHSQRRLSPSLLIRLAEDLEAVFERAANLRYILPPNSLTSVLGQRWAPLTNAYSGKGNTSRFNHAKLAFAQHCELASLQHYALATLLIIRSTRNTAYAKVEFQEIAMVLLKVAWALKGSLHAAIPPLTHFDFPLILQTRAAVARGFCSSQACNGESAKYLPWSWCGLGCV